MANRNQMVNFATLAIGVGSMFVGADNWGDSMNAVEQFNGNPNPGVTEKVAEFLSDQPEVFNEVFIDPNLGPDESPIENAQHAAEIAALLFASGLVVTVASGSALKK